MGPWLTRKDRRNKNKTGKRESKRRSQQDPVEGERGARGWTLLLFMFSKGESADFSFVQSWWVTAWLPERNQTVLHSGLLKPGVQRLRADAIGFETFEPVRQWKTNSNKKKGEKGQTTLQKVLQTNKQGEFFFLQTPPAECQRPLSDPRSAVALQSIPFLPPFIMHDFESMIESGCTHQHSTSPGNLSLHCQGDYWDKLTGGLTLLFWNHMWFLKKALYVLYNVYLNDLLSKRRLWKQKVIYCWEWRYFF